MKTILSVEGDLKSKLDIPRPSRNKMGWLTVGLACGVAINPAFSLAKIKDAIDDAVRKQIYRIQPKIKTILPYQPIQNMKSPLEIDYELMLIIGLFHGAWKKKSIPEFANAIESGGIVEAVYLQRNLEKIEKNADKILDSIMKNMHISNVVWSD